MRFLAIVFTLLGLNLSAQMTSSSSASHRDVDISHLMKKPEPLPENEKAVRLLNMSCKTQSGEELTAKDKNFDDCMHRSATGASEEMKAKRNQKSF